MELRISVPESLMDYLEYIPEEFLPGILLTLIEDRIQASGEVKTDDGSLKLLKQFIASIPAGQPVENINVIQETQEELEPVTPGILQTTSSGEDDDLDDFMDFLK